MSRAQHRETVEQIRLEVERIRLDFTVSQIETAYALARSAQIFYMSGSTKQADGVQFKAWDAYQSAVNLLNDFSAERKIHHQLTGKLSQVRAILDVLPLRPVREGLGIAGESC